MTNHPSRNWRTRMRAACAKHLALWRWPADGAALLTPDQLRNLMTHSYESGYQEGRESMRPAPKSQK